MSRIATLCFFVSLVLGFSLHPVNASPVAGGSVRMDWVDYTGFPNLLIHLSAWNGSGLPLRDLTVDNFSLQEEGLAPVHPLSIKSDTQAPISVALVIDISGSMAGAPLEDAKAAAARFLDRLSASDQAALIAFSDTLNPDSQVLDAKREIGLTADKTALYDIIEGLQAGGGTHLYNAVGKAAGLFNGRPAGRHAILLLSDGRNEPADVGSAESPLALAKENNIPIFVIGLGTNIDETYLRRLATESGGFFYLAPGSAELARLFGDTASLLKTQYLIAYTSQLPADGKTHPLEITLNSQDTQGKIAVELGPLPKTPVLTATRASTETPAAPATFTPQPIPSQTLIQPSPVVGTNVTPTESSLYALSDQPIQTNFPWWGMGIGAVLILISLLLSWYYRRFRPAPEVCADCGFDLTGKTGACPHCKSTRRLPKR